MGECGALPAVGIGALTEWCPPELIDRVVDKCHRREHWVRLLPARTMAYFELARCLFPAEGYARVYEHLLPLPAAVPVEGGLGVRVPNKSSLCKARAKLGPEVMEALFREVAGPRAEPTTCPGAFWRGLRLLSLDGAVLAVADTTQNEAAFGRSVRGDFPAAYPQARILGINQAQLNKIVGDAYRDHIADSFAQRGLKVTTESQSPQLLRFDTPYGVRQYDIGLLDSQGKVTDYIETKSGDAGKDALQAKKDEWLRQNLGIKIQYVHDGYGR